MRNITPFKLAAAILGTGAFMKISALAIALAILGAASAHAGSLGPTVATSPVSCAGALR